jgi:acetyl-CoA carboxylase biotin carboxyl carrier protein
MMDFTQIQEIIRMVGKHKISEFSLKDGDFKMTIRSQAGHTEAAPATTSVMVPVQQPLMPMVAPVAPAAPAPAPAEAPAPAPAVEKAEAAAPAAANTVTIKSPMVGTFYRSSSPDKPPFVKVGDMVDAGQRVCIIEAMKLFNEIESDVKGKIVKILVDDAKPVEYDQPLFLVEV